MATDNAGPEEILVPVQGATLFCRVMGHGSPIIVLHGGPGLSQDYLLPHMLELAKTHRVIFYDQRGCGRSTGDVNAETINISCYVSDLEAVRKAFGCDDVTILGHSWGAFLAIHYAIVHPEHIGKLILSHPAPASSQDYAAFAAEYTRHAAAIKDELAAIEASPAFRTGDPDTTERWWRLQFSFYWYNRDRAEHLNVRMSPSAFLNGQRVFACLQDSIFSKPYDLMPVLQNLKIPTLVISSDTDVMPSFTAQHIASNIKDSRYVLMTHCGHFPFVEDPQPYFQIVKDFLSGS